MPGYKPFHINRLFKERTPIGDAKGRSYLGSVIINTPGQVVLTLYNGSDAVAEIDSTTAIGTSFEYNCLLDKGLAFTVTPRPKASGINHSITVTYDDSPSRRNVVEEAAD